MKHKCKSEYCGICHNKKSDTVKCRLGHEMSRKEDEHIVEPLLKKLGIPFGGSWVCLTCYPNKKNEVIQ